jgi:hypothetical protein
MSHRLPVPTAPITRRRVLQGLGAGALGALFAGCATVPQAPLRPLERALAPRVGESWRYQYTSAIRNVPPRVLEVRVLDVTDEGVRDRLSADGEAAGDERRFGSALELVARPVSGLMVYEFSPYLLAFGGFPAGSGTFAAAVPPSSWGTQWTATVTVRGSERITVPAGSFDALRVEIHGSRLFIRGQMDDAIDPVWLDATVWYAPAAKRVVQFAYFTQAWGRNFLARDQHQLVAHRPG